MCFAKPLSSRMRANEPLRRHPPALRALWPCGQYPAGMACGQVFGVGYVGDVKREAPLVRVGLVWGSLCVVVDCHSIGRRIQPSRRAESHAVGGCAYVIGQDTLSFFDQIGVDVDSLVAALLCAGVIARSAPLNDFLQGVGAHRVLLSAPRGAGVGMRLWLLSGFGAQYILDCRL